MDNDDFEKLVKSRYAYRKNYDPEILISAPVMDKVLELTNYTPSSFGLSPWRLCIISNKKKKMDLFPYIDYQPMVTDCSHLILILSNLGSWFNIEDCVFLHSFIEQRKEKIISSSNSDEKKTIDLKALSFFKKKNNEQISNWSKNQSFILLHNLLLSFTSFNIHTSPMGGFNNEKVINYLETNNFITKNQYQVAVVLAAGYAKGGTFLMTSRKEKKRKDRELTTFID